MEPIPTLQFLKNHVGDDKMILMFLLFCLRHFSTQKTYTALAFV